MLLRRLLLTLFLATGVSVSAQAGGLADAFSKVAGGGYSTSSGAKSFSTRTLDGVSLGGASVRIHQEAINLFNFDPPSFEVGCRGMDMHMGGFSWISGEQLQAMLNNIAQAAPYVVFQIAMKALFPDLSALIGQVTGWMRALSQMSLDSCAAAQALAGGVTASLAGLLPDGESGGSASSGDSGGDDKGFFAKATSKVSSLGDKSTWTGAASSAKERLGDVTIESCKTLATGLANMGRGFGRGVAASNAADWQQAQQETCNDGGGVGKSWQMIKDAFNNSTPDEKQMMTGLIGNSTWDALSYAGYGANTSNYISDSLNKDYPSVSAISSDIIPIELLGPLALTMVGTTLNNGDSPDATQRFKESGPKEGFGAGTVSSVLLCGSPSRWKAEKPTTPAGKPISEKAATFCRSRYGMIKDEGGKTDLRVYRCVTESCDPTVNNKNMLALPIDEGSDPFTSALASYPGFLSVVEDKLTSAVKKVQSGEVLDSAERQIILMAPFPLWKAVNMAAVAPAIAEKLITDNSYVLSVMMMSSVLKHVAYGIRIRYDNNVRAPASLVADAQAIASAIATAPTADAYEDLMTLQRTQAIIMSKVKTVNVAVMKEAFATGITGADFASAMNGG